LFSGNGLRTNLAALVSQSGLARATVTIGSHTLADVGDRLAIAPGVAYIVSGGRRRRTAVSASEITATQYARELSGRGVAVVVRQGPRTLSATLAAATRTTFPRDGTVSVSGTSYRAVTLTLPGFGRARVHVTVLSSNSATAGALGTSRVVAAVFILAFLLLAFRFSIYASRQLQAQLSGFLAAARRLATGDFSSRIRTEGHDEFAALGEEFNNMSSQLAKRLEELSQERARLRESIRRIGQALASNLDRPALLELVLKTAIDAVEASCGRLSVSRTADEQLSEIARVGSLAGVEETISDAERAAFDSGGVHEDGAHGFNVASVPLGAIESAPRAYGVITVARRGGAFTDDDREVLRSLATQASVALENVDLHFQVQRQAVTDELTGLSNHRRFQELLESELEQVRRYEYPVGLIMLDVDDFKAVNDTYGHQQGDVVLRHVARVLRENSRDPDVPARYGGEELALILPHTELEGAYVIAERVRAAIEGLRISRVDQRGILRITASVGVAASTDGDKMALIADADAALYAAKRQGKNCTVRAPLRAANMFGAE
jgi:diguanylate cyclase (GGDEF)-like protein